MTPGGDRQQFVLMSPPLYARYRDDAGSGSQGPITSLLRFSRFGELLDVCQNAVVDLVD